MGRAQPRPLTSSSSIRSPTQFMANDITITSIAHLIQLSVAPVFLLTGVGSILSVLAARLGRIVDRSRVLEANMPNVSGTQQALAHLELSRLSRRAGLINWSIS